MILKIKRQGDDVTVIECTDKTERKVASIASGEEATLITDNRVTSVTYTKKLP